MNLGTTLGNVALAISFANAAVQIVDWFISARAKAAVIDRLERFYIWLDDRRKIQQVRWLFSRPAWLAVAALSCVGCVVLAASILADSGGVKNLGPLGLPAPAPSLSGEVSLSELWFVYYHKRWWALFMMIAAAGWSLALGPVMPRVGIWLTSEPSKASGGRLLKILSSGVLPWISFHILIGVSVGLDSVDSPQGSVDWGIVFVWTVLLTLGLLVMVLTALSLIWLIVWAGLVAATWSLSVVVLRLTENPKGPALAASALLAAFGGVLKVITR